MVDLLHETLVETDPRFPSGPWTGYWRQPPVRHRGLMDMLLTFKDGQLSGVGRDVVGNFLFRGHYDLPAGACRWVKSYLGKHDVRYEGQSRGKGIVGFWTIADASGVLQGSFVIWPEGAEDPTLGRLMEEADPPLANTLETETLPLPLLIPEAIPAPLGGKP
jgi:hypothetical protein